MSDLVSGGGGGGRCSDLVRGGGETRSDIYPPRDKVRTSTPSPPSGTRSEHLPPPPPLPGPGQNIYPLPPPGPGQNICPLPPSGTRSEHLPPPPSQDQVRTSTPFPPTTRRRAVRILLECILVCTIFYSRTLVTETVHTK